MATEAHTIRLLLSSSTCVVNDALRTPRSSAKAHLNQSRRRGVDDLACGMCGGRVGAGTVVVMRLYTEEEQKL